MKFKKFCAFLAGLSLTLSFGSVAKAATPEHYTEFINTNGNAIAHYDLDPNGSSTKGLPLVKYEPTKYVQSFKLYSDSYQNLLELEKIGPAYYFIQMSYLGQSRQVASDINSYDFGTKKRIMGDGYYKAFVKLPAPNFKNGFVYRFYDDLDPNKLIGCLRVGDAVYKGVNYASIDPNCNANDPNFVWFSKSGYQGYLDSIKIVTPPPITKVNATLERVSRTGREVTIKWTNKGTQTVQQVNLYHKLLGATTMSVVGAPKNVQVSIFKNASANTGYVYLRGPIAPGESVSYKLTLASTSTTGQVAMETNVPTVYGGNITLNSLIGWGISF
ncbi:MAG: hypothetical protein ACRCXZ_05225 [Patescibacteria group bacterium]